MAARLEHKDKIYGMLAASLPSEYLEEKEEKDLFSEVAADISYALYSIEQEEKNREFFRELEIINETALKISRLNNIEKICSYIADIAYSLNKNAIVAVSLYDSSEDAIKIKSFSGVSNFVERFIKVSGFNPLKLSFNIEKSRDEKLYKSGKVEYVPGGLYNIAEGKIPKNICQKLEKTFKRSEVYYVGFALGDKPFGGIIFFLPKGEALESSHVIANIARYISSVVSNLTAQDNLESMVDSTIELLGKVVEIRDAYTSGHQKRVAEISEAIAKKLGLEDSEVKKIKMAAQIHDIGKISIPVSILSKPEKLSDIEFGLIKTHPQVGYDLIKDASLSSETIPEIVLQHHERFNGSGYPQGLKGKDIIFGAKIIGVADVVEAISSHRPYRPALGMNKALEEINKGRGKLYDPRVVDACLELFEKEKFKFS